MKAVSLDELYAIAIVEVLVQHPNGLTKEVLEHEATDWLHAVKQTLVSQLPA
jgi:hypothetical protein